MMSKLKVGDIVRLPDEQQYGRGRWHPWGEKGFVVSILEDRWGTGDYTVKFINGFVGSYVQSELIVVE